MLGQWENVFPILLFPILLDVVKVHTTGALPFSHSRQQCCWVSYFLQFHPNSITFFFFFLAILFSENMVFHYSFNLYCYYYEHIVMLTCITSTFLLAKTHSLLNLSFCILFLWCLPTFWVFTVCHFHWCKHFMLRIFYW